MLMSTLLTYSYIEIFKASKYGMQVMIDTGGVIWSHVLKSIYNLLLSLLLAHVLLRSSFIATQIVKTMHHVSKIVKLKKKEEQYTSSWREEKKNSLYFLVCF